MEQILCFFNTWSSAIQAIMVIVLVLITIWYARSTKEMAKLMNKEYALNSMPMLSIGRDVDRDLKENVATNKMVQLIFHYFNLGRVPVRYYTRKVKLNKKSINPKKTESNLFPQQTGTLKTDFYKSENYIGEGDGLEGEIEVVYWAVGIPEQKYLFHKKFKLTPGVHTIIIKEEVKSISK